MKKIDKVFANSANNQKIDLLARVFVLEKYGQQADDINKYLKTILDSADILNESDNKLINKIAALLVSFKHIAGVGAMIRARSQNSPVLKLIYAKYSEANQPEQGRGRARSDSVISESAIKPFATITGNAVEPNPPQPSIERNENRASFLSASQLQSRRSNVQDSEGFDFGSALSSFNQEKDQRQQEISEQIAQIEIILKSLDDDIKKEFLTDLDLVLNLNVSQILANAQFSEDVAGLAKKIIIIGFVDKNKNAALKVALEKNNYTLAEFLIENGVSVSEELECDYLKNLAQINPNKLAQLLLSNIRNIISSGERSRDEIALKNLNLFVLLGLKDHILKFPEDVSGQNIFHIIAEKGYLETCKYLLQILSDFPDLKKKYITSHNVESQNPIEIAYNAARRNFDYASKEQENSVETYAKIAQSCSTIHQILCENIGVDREQYPSEAVKEIQVLSDKDKILRQNVLEGNYLEVLSALSQGADPYKVDKKGRSAFDIANDLLELNTKQNIQNALLYFYPEGSTFTDKVQLVAVNISRALAGKDVSEEIRKEIKDISDSLISCLLDRAIITNDQLAKILRNVADGIKLKLQSTIEKYTEILPSINVFMNNLSSLIKANQNDTSNRFIDREKVALEHLQSGDGRIVRNDDSFLRISPKIGGLTSEGFVAVLRIVVSRQEDNNYKLDDVWQKYTNYWLIKKCDEPDLVPESYVSELARVLLPKRAEVRQTSLTDENKNRYVAVEYVPNAKGFDRQNISSYVDNIEKENGAGELSRSLVQNLVAVILLGHVDTKADNVLFSGDDYLTIIDWGWMNARLTKIIQQEFYLLISAIENKDFANVRKILSLQNLFEKYDELHSKSLSGQISFDEHQKLQLLGKMGAAKETSQAFYQMLEKIPDDNLQFFINEIFAKFLANFKQSTLNGIFQKFLQNGSISILNSVHSLEYTEFLQEMNSKLAESAISYELESVFDVQNDNQNTNQKSNIILDGITQTNQNVNSVDIINYYAGLLSFVASNNGEITLAGLYKPADQSSISSVSCYKATISGAIDLLEKIESPRSDTSDFLSVISIIFPSIDKKSIVAGQIQVVINSNNFNSALRICDEQKLKSCQANFERAANILLNIYAKNKQNNEANQESMLNYKPLFERALDCLQVFGCKMEVIENIKKTLTVDFAENRPDQATNLQNFNRVQNPNQKQK